MTSTSIYKPTWLYIKRHNLTGMLYFGKTAKSGKQFDKYKGSGQYWLSHIRKHGSCHVETIWSELFIDENNLIEFATFFSEFYDIVKSDKWANLVVEDGVRGTPSSHILPIEIGERISISKTGKKNPKTSELRRGGKWYKSVLCDNEIYVLRDISPPEGYIPGRIIDVSGKKNGMFGKKRTEEWGRNHSEFMKSLPRGKDHKLYGIPRSQETKDRISAGWRNPNRKPRKPHTQEHKDRISAAMRNKSN